MPDERLDTHEKALAVKLEPSIHGTIAEICAGEEVARTFQAGGASGSSPGPSRPTT